MTDCPYPLCHATHVGLVLPGVPPVCKHDGRQSQHIDLMTSCVCASLLGVVQDVPVAALQQQRDKHFQETYNLRLSASAVRTQPLGH